MLYDDEQWRLIQEDCITHMPRMEANALQNNLVFWGLCWESSRRGGHYEFVLPPTAREKTSA